MDESKPDNVKPFIFALRNPLKNSNNMQRILQEDKQIQPKKENFDILDS